MYCTKYSSICTKCAENYSELHLEKSGPSMDSKVIFTVTSTVLFFVCCIKEVICSKRSWMCLKQCRCSEIQDTFVVDCSNTGLEFVPNGLPPRTTHLLLNNNNIQVLSNDSFVQSRGRLPNLITVSIRSNPLTKIEINAFRGLLSLKILDLYNNNLQFKDSYPKSVFVHINQSLEVLDIRRNLLGDISEMSYPVSVGELLGLGELKIDCLRNKSLPLEYSKLKNLTKLSFSDGRKQVRFVSDDMFLAVSALGITDIDLAGLDIAVIGINTFLSVPKLKILDLSNNEYLNVTSIIPALKKTSIETLKLNNTKIGQETVLTKFLETLGELHLKKLTLDNNTIANIDPIFSENLPDLEVLSLGNNFLREPIDLWYDFMKLKHLIGLNISWQDKNTVEATVRTTLMKPATPGKVLSKGMSKDWTVGEWCSTGMACVMIFPPKLEWIDISQNGIKAQRLPELAFIQNSTLKSVDASYNGIHIVEKPIYCEKTKLSSIVPRVETLNFNNNALQCVTSAFLSHCDWSSLKHFYFRNNKLGQVEGNVCNRDKNNTLGFIKPAINLEVLDLAGDQIQNGEQLSALQGLTKLNEIDLSSNGFHNFPLTLQKMTRLSKVNLSNNNIHCLSVSTILELNKLQNQKPKTDQIEVDLSGNVLSCTCECFLFFQWMMGTELLLKNGKNYECEFNDGKKESLNKLTFIVAKLESQCFGSQWLEVCLSLEVITYFLITAACLTYRRRYDIRYLFLKMKLNRHKLRKILDTQNYTYSAFVSCDHRDAKYFVYRKFLPNLETPETKLQFCVAQRNFLVGATILDNIIRAINKSRKVIFIVSEYFLGSKWCQEELMIAHQVGLF